METAGRQTTTPQNKETVLGEGDGTPLQYSCLENPMTEEPGRLQSMGSLRVGHDGATFTFHFHALEEEMATHSSVLAWRIPGTGEPGGLPSMGSHRVGHDWSDLAAAVAAAAQLCLKVISIWRKQRQWGLDMPGGGRIAIFLNFYWTTVAF